MLDVTAALATRRLSSREPPTMPIDIFRVGFVPARALTARYPTVSTPQTKGRTMATASKLSVPKPVNLPSMKKVRGGERNANRNPNVCRLERSFFSCRDERASFFR